MAWLLAHMDDLMQSLRLWVTGSQRSLWAMESGVFRKIQELQYPKASLTLQ